MCLCMCVLGEGEWAGGSGKLRGTLGVYLDGFTTDMVVMVRSVLAASEPGVCEGPFCFFNFYLWCFGPLRNPRFFVLSFSNVISLRVEQQVILQMNKSIPSEKCFYSKSVTSPYFHLNS